MNFNHQQDDTRGIILGLLSLFALILFVSLIAWLSTHLH